MLAGALRFAGKALASEAGRAAIPRGIGMAYDLAPNAIFGLLSAASLPEGTDLGTRLGAAAEDLLVSVPLGWAGRFAGYKGAKAIGAMRGKPLSPDSFGFMINMAGQAPEQAAWWSGMMPRPFASKAYGDYQARMSEQQLQEQAMRDERIRMDLVERLGGAGLLAAPFQQNLGWGTQA